MSLSQSGVPLFAGVEDVDDLFIATMDEMDKEVVSHLTIEHPLWKYYEENDRIELRDSIGLYVPVKLLVKENSTVKDFTHYDDVDMTPQDGLEEAKFPYGHIIGTQMYSREELVKNSGPEQLVDLVETKATQLKESMNNFFNTRIMGSQLADGRQFTGLGRIMNPTLACGGIDPAAAGFGYWAPQSGVKTGGGQYSLATEMRLGLRSLFRKCAYQGQEPDLMVCGEDLFDKQLDYWEGKVQVTLVDSGSKTGGSGLSFKDNKGKTYIYDATLAAKEGWAINTKNTPIRIHKGTNFTMTAWEKVKGKEAKARNCLVYASIYTKRRNMNGKIVFT